MADAKMKVVFECRIDMSKIQAAVEKVQAALAEFGVSCEEASEKTAAVVTELQKRSASGLGPEIGSLFVLRDDEEGAAVWRVMDLRDPDHPYRIRLERIGSSELKDVSVAELSRDFEPLSDKPALQIPAPESTWEFADGRDPGGVWVVNPSYRGDLTMVELFRWTPELLEGDSAPVWRGTVANHNKTFRRSNG